MTTYRSNLCIAALGLVLTLVGAPAFAAPSAMADAPASESTTARGTPTPAVPALDRGHAYARREAAAPVAAEFRGKGAGVYIGGSTVAVVLVVVLIVLLL